MVHNLPDAEDVFQQAAITMWEKFDQFEAGSDFPAWACSVARFKALNFLNSKKRERACFSEQLIDELASREVHQPELQEARLRALAACREKLSQVDQNLLALCYGGSGTVREVAVRIGRPVGSVYDSLSRIRRGLFACIQQKLANEEY
jgi:RNA polymerase sigma-70 factor (ECF subfamily)